MRSDHLAPIVLVLLIASRVEWLSVRVPLFLSRSFGCLVQGPALKKEDTN